MVFGLTRPGIEPESTVLIADALFFLPLTGLIRAAQPAYEYGCIFLKFAKISYLF